MRRRRSSRVKMRRRRERSNSVLKCPCLRYADYQACEGFLPGANDGQVITLTCSSKKGIKGMFELIHVHGLHTYLVSCSRFHTRITQEDKFMCAPLNSLDMHAHFKVISK